MSRKTRSENEEDCLSLEQLETIFLQSLDLIGAGNLDGYFTTINPSFERVLGYTKEEFLLAPFLDFVYQEDLAKTKKALVAAASGRKEVSIENRYRCKDGSAKWIDWKVFSDVPENLFIAVGRDITEKKIQEEERQKIIKLESVAILAGGIAHDFNNILAAILGNINLALFDNNLDEKTKRLLSEAEKASLRAKDLTQQLLTFAKGGEPIKEASSLEDIIKESASFVLSGNKVSCQYNLPEDLWLADIDKGQISQVIQNIVLNASHAMPEGGVINISGENLSSVCGTRFPSAKGKYITISIQDSGIGMPGNIIDKIFDPYFSTKQEGSGLGLAIIQSIIMKHHGHIIVDSCPGIGSTFTLYLPASGIALKAKHQESPIKVASPARILVMDDDEMVRNIANEMLDHLGHEVILAADGQEAVGLYKEAIRSGNLIELLIFDLTIPGGMGGKDSVRKILNINPKAKVIVSSGYSNDPVMASFEEYGFCAAVVKPYQLQELARTISQFLDRKKLVR